VPATRREAIAAFAGLSGAATFAAQRAMAAAQVAGHDGSHGGNTVVGDVDHATNGFTPYQLLTEFDYGETSTGADGRPVREWTITAVDKEIEIAPGVFFPAWAYDGRVPGPALRCVEGERLRIHFNNGGSHPHTIHLHSIHPARMDGIAGAGLVAPGESFTYEVDAEPFGCHLYHCHSLPLKRHIHKGLYGALIIDPDPDRHPENREAAQSRRHGTPDHARWQEFIMVMNGFDTNFDDENEFYAMNSIAFAYAHEPIRVARSQPVRIYLINVTEFDPVNSFHLHGNFYDYYDHGTTLTPTLRMVDTVMQCQGQRGVLEIEFANTGTFMFHAHQSEFAELGWMGFFEVVD
jgi:FtsP/CotA-like multicopper oxidase with cupredoxin domain